MYKVGVIGLGNIASRYSNPSAENPYCHVGGIRFSDQVELTAVADLLDCRRDEFRSVWGEVFPGINYYESGKEMLDAEQFDIVAVCVRGPQHFDVMMDVIEAGPKAIFKEKPGSCSLEEMDTMLKKAGEKNIPITVSYTRHWDPVVLRMQELVSEGVIGEVQSVVGYVGGAVLSFGIHTTDLICQFAGYCPTAVYARGRNGTQTAEGYEPEPSLDSMLVEFENGVRGIQIGHDGEHGGFYCEVVGTEGTIRTGIYMAPMMTKEGKAVDLTPYDIPARKSPFTVAYGQIAAHLDGGALPHCTNEHFRVVNELGFAAVESIRTDQRITLPNQNRTRRIFANG